MSLERLRLDAPFIFAFTLSVVLHVALLSVFVGNDRPQRPDILSSINVQLSALTQIPTGTPQPSEVVQPPDTSPVETTVAPAIVVPELPTINSTSPPTSTNETSTIATSSPAPTIVKLNVSSLRDFIDSSVEPAPPAMDDTALLADQYRKLWHQRVQRIGQLNYPAAAAQLNRTGQLTLQVAINANGSLGNVAIVRSSGHDELDLAALEIVRQSQPFDPLPIQLPRDDGQFRFLSTWEFRH